MTSARPTNLSTLGDQLRDAPLWSGAVPVPQLGWVSEGVLPARSPVQPRLEVGCLAIILGLSRNA